MTLGLELCESGCQLTYITGADIAPQVVSEITDGQQCIIPMAAVINPDTDEFIYGSKALEFYEAQPQESKPKLIKDIYIKAVQGDTFITNGHEYTGYEVLLGYIRWILSLTAMIADWRKAEHISLTCEKIDVEIIDMFKRLTVDLEMENRMSIISYQESIFEYIVHQQPELWHHDVMLLDYMKKGVTCKLFNVNKRTKPAVCTVEEMWEETLDVHNDMELKRFCKWHAEDRIITSVYMVGEPLAENEIPQTLAYLCMKRRVFQGQNLYAKGACYAAYNRAHILDNQDASHDGYLFLGQDKLRTNVGVKVQELHEEKYVPFVDAGISWYEVDKDYEMYLGRERELRLLVTPISGQNEHYAVIRLSAFPQRPEHTTRVRIRMYMDTRDCLTLKIEDLGFGQIFPASGQVITEKIKIE